jgi:hypothetical protein
MLLMKRDKAGSTELKENQKIASKKKKYFLGGSIETLSVVQEMPFPTSQSRAAYPEYIRHDCTP